MRLWDMPDDTAHSQPSFRWTSPRQLWAEFRKRFLTQVGPILGIGVLLMGALAFLKVAEETFEGETKTIDTAILLALRNPADPADPIGPAWLEHSLSDITALGGFAVLTLLISMIGIYLVVVRKWGTAVLLAASVGSGTLLSETLKMGFNRTRPDLVAHLVDTQSASFPSGHAMLSAITYLTIGVLLARVSKGRTAKGVILTFAILITALIGASRIYLGVHWPSDVLAGWCLGAAWAALWWLVAWALQRQGRISENALPPA